jgi:hypothetical protein
MDDLELSKPHEEVKTWDQLSGERPGWQAGAQGRLN